MTATNEPVPDPKQPPAPRMPVRRGDAGAPTSALVRAMWLPLLPVRIAFMPLGWLFRIREPLPVLLRALLPMTFLALIGLVWYASTKGEAYLARGSDVSGIEDRKLRWEAKLGTPIELSTGPPLMKSQQRDYLTVTAVAMPKAAYDAQRAVVEATFDKGDYDVVEDGSRVRLVAHSRFGPPYEKWSAFQKAFDPLEASLPGWKPEVVQPRPDDKERMTTILSALVPKAVADKPETHARLDRLIGKDSYVLTETPDGVRITGRELVEERLVSPLLLPSPKEMGESIPSLLHGHWRTWDDAIHWWKLGGLEAGAVAANAPPPPRPLEIDWKERNEIPFRTAEWVFGRLIGPEWKEWKLFHAIAWSGLRIFMGFLYALLFAVPLGVIMGTFSKPRAFFEPLVLMGSYLPLPALYPLTLFWWSIGEAQKVGFLAICTFVVLLPQVIMAIDAVPQEHLLAAETLGATRWQRMRFILLGGALADIMRALRLSFAVGWTWIVLAEGLNPEQGLGWVIALGQRRDELRPHIYAVVLLIVILAYAINTVWARCERWLFPYREQG